MRDIFFDSVDVTRGANGVYVIALQTKSKVRGGKPDPVAIVSCRQAGALDMIEAIFRVLRK